MLVEMTGSAPLLRDWLGSRSSSERLTLAQCWRLDARDAVSAEHLAAALLQPETVARMVAGLGQRERLALEFVQSYGGRVAARILEREFGGVREHHQYPNPRAFLLALERPPEPTEKLFLMALLHRADGPPACYLIPSDLLMLLPVIPPRDSQLGLRAVESPSQVQHGDSRWFERMALNLLADAYHGRVEVTASGALTKASLQRLRRGWESRPSIAAHAAQSPFERFLPMLLAGVGLVRVAGNGQLRPTRAALTWMRGEPLERARRLLDGWVESAWDELTALCGLRILAPFRRDVSVGKRALLALLGQAPTGEWLALDDLVRAIYRVEPDFARPDGDYQSWRIETAGRSALDGFAHWEQVEGALIRAVSARTLRWLGLVDVGLLDGRPVSVRLTPLGTALLQEGPAPEDPPEAPLVLQPNFEIVIPPSASLYARFQIARIAESAVVDTAEVVRLTRRSIHAALEQGIEAAEIGRFLEEWTGRALPQNVAATLAEWSDQYGQVTLRGAVLLEVESAALLEQIQHDRRLRLDRSERISDRALAIAPPDAPVLAERLRRAGYGLAGAPSAREGPLSESDLTVLSAALDFYRDVCGELGLEHDATNALRKRVTRLLSEHQIGRARQMSAAALQALHEQRGEKP